MPPPIQINARSWTLRFKNNRSTFMLHVDPLQKLSSVRAELLKAVRDTHPDGSLHGRSISRHEDGILLAKPIDINDLGAGWEPLERSEDDDMFAERSNGKGKAAVNKSKSKSTLKDCPQGAGLRDGGIVAFKFKIESNGEEDDTRSDIGEDDQLDGKTLVGEPEEARWDVIIPTMEETYADDEAPTLGPQATRMGFKEVT